MSEIVAEVADRYFSNLNSIAARIYTDITETKNTYEELWDKLTPKEQSQIIDETIIKPEISLKYALTQPKSDSKDVENIQYGQKVIHDEHFTYRDEYSAPFSFKTQSQLDLRIFSENATIPGSPLLKSHTGTKIQDDNFVSKEKTIPVKKFESYTEFDKISSDTDLKISSPVSIEAVTETPSETSHDEKACLLPSAGVLRTGYDFLDNW